MDLFNKIWANIIYTKVCFVKGSCYPVMHIKKQKTKFQATDSMGRVYAEFKDFNSALKWINQ